MDTMAALALATDPPTDAILDRPPQPKSAPLITVNVSFLSFATAQSVTSAHLYRCGK